jgi:large subunit ribosomal protein L25
MEAATIKASARRTFGTKATARLRQTGMLPAIIYGHKETPEAVALAVHDVELALARGAHLWKVEIGGKQTQYLLKDVQFDHLGTAPIHVDLSRVRLDERVKVKVPIELRGTPAGTHEGGVLDQMMFDLEVECLVTEIPDKIRLMVDHLHLGKAMHTKEVQLPDGVRALGHADEIICMVRAQTAAAEEAVTPAAETEGAAEPELIRRKEETEEPGGE